VLGNDVVIWSITALNPHNDILRRAEDQAIFKTHLRRLFDRIKAAHGEHAIINIFPALPKSLAVEVGRVCMPKADLPLRGFTIKTARLAGLFRRSRLRPQRHNAEGEPLGNLADAASGCREARPGQARCREADIPNVR
jgi:hypothetical protein